MTYKMTEEDKIRFELLKKKIKKLREWIFTCIICKTREDISEMTHTGEGYACSSCTAESKRWD